MTDDLKLVQQKCDVYQRAWHRAEDRVRELEQRCVDAEKAAAGLSADLSYFGRQLERIAHAVEAWENDVEPDEDFPFEADMDFVNFCGHVARSALANV